MADSNGMSRIIYIEPNDSMGHIGDVPLTPDYSDLCIAFNLIVEIVPRFKSNAAQGTDATEQYCLYWRSRAPIDGKQFSEGNYVSFLHGENGFLTTYYTDTNYEDVVKKNIVEGLGIENVTVAFENYYTPTVTIKFVDQRGSSLFGREEATHNDDKLTIDNIFGAFFTAPYPKFKLQIKGFYGQAVTLQLTCSGFKGSLNPQTGNFEATATFIGYSYSLLTDIPFQYIVAAPYCGYVGRDYWAQNAGSAEWSFSDGKPMITIHDFMGKVNDAMTNAELLKVISDENQEIIKNGETETGAITDILVSLNRLKNSFELAVSNCFVENYTGTPIDDEQLLLFCESPKIPETNDIKLAWETLKEKVKDYNENYGSNEIPKSSMPNEISPDGNLFEMCCVKVFNIDFGKDGKTLSVTFADGTGGTNNPSALKKLDLNTNGKSPRKISDSLAEVLATHLTPGSVTEKIKTHAYLIDFHDLRKRLRDRSVYIDDETIRIEQTAERNYIELAESNLSMVPYIGNVFKMIMAHIDTFVHIMYSCYDRIRQQATNGQRDSGYLGVNLSRTDVVMRNGQKDIPAWPLVTKASAAQKSEYVTQEEENTIGWVGDVSPGMFEEEKLVRALFLACKRTSGDEFRNKEEETNVNYVPIIPSDISILENAFQGNNDADISTLAGILGMRSAQLFGITEKSAIENTTAKVMGRMDAYNYYLANPSKSEINSRIIDACGNKSLADKVRDIMLCKEEEDSMADTYQNGEKAHPFERKPGVIGNERRHPIYVENGQMMKYVHYYTKNHFALVPSVIKSFGMYDSQYLYKRYDGKDYGYFDYKWSNNTIQNTLVNCDTKTLQTELDENQFDLDNFVNTEMFNVEMNPLKVDGIMKRYDELKTKSFKIRGEQFEDDFSKVLDRYWHVDDGHYKKAVNSLLLKLTNRLSDIGVDKTNWTHEEYKKIRDAKVSYSGNNEWGDGQTVDSLFFPSMFLCYEKPNVYGSLFGSPFYYMQNSIEDKKTRDRVKALLILHSICNNSGFVLPSAFSGKKQCGGIELANYAHMLLVGGLMWRESFEKDPILYKYNYDGTVFNFEKPANGVHSTLFHNDGKASRLTVFKERPDENWKPPYRDVSDVYGTAALDYHVRNILIRNFETFVDTDCQTLFKRLDLKSIDGEGKLMTPAKIRHLYKGDENKGNGLENASDWAAVKNLINKNFKDFFSSYEYLDVKPDSATVPFDLCFKEDDVTVQNLLKRLYAGTCIVIDTPARWQKIGGESRPQGENTDVTVQTSNLNAYLEGFSEALKKITGSVGETAIDSSDKSSVEFGDIAEFDRDVAIPIYMYLKMVWDKWLVASDKLNPYDNEYTVKKFFNNFVFIDSFYRDISSRFMMNCGILLQRYTENHMGTKDYSVFKYIGDITTDHNCMFLAVPDFIDDMGINDNGKKKAAEALSTIFKPIPYEQMRDMDLNNKFIIIYVPKLSETPSEINNFTEDGFNIWSYNEGDGVCPPILKATSANIDDVSPYGYFVPSFGLAYGRQHNHLFKSVNLNMETPIITSAVINTLSHIARMGASNEHAIAFVGQDIYPVFSNYSYICEFEMMGCAQIQPLMYFQLMNVPMWRGTYMIFNVTHVMTPGNMVTKVKAMKLSCRAVPYSNAWFKKNLNYNPDGENGSGADCGDTSTYSSDYVYNGPIESKKYIDLKKVLESRGTNSYYNGSGVHRSLRTQDYHTPLRKDLSTGHAECTCGPQTFIQDGLKAKAINSKIPGNLRPKAWKDGTTKCALPDFGFRRIAVLHSISEIDSYKAQPCDIMTVFSTVDGHQHMCMWDGKNWVSDYVQRTAWPYHRSGYGISKTKEQPSVWRFDDNLWYEINKKYLD